MHVYVFGSIPRGDFSRDSDVDLLAIVEGFDPRLDPNTYSIYSYARIQELWEEGNPFAWHLSRESRVVFSSSGTDYLQGLGVPNEYTKAVEDCEKFHSLFQEARRALDLDGATASFDLSVIFLSMRNIATCFSLGAGNPDFSRNSARHLGAYSIPLEDEPYDIFVRARMLCTRGSGLYLSPEEIKLAASKLPQIDSWMTHLVQQARTDERVQ